MRYTHKEITRMKVIRSFAAVADLDLPNNIQSQLYHNLTAPFNGDEQETTELWNELGNLLILIEAGDIDATLANADSSVQSLIQSATDIPEFVLLLADDRNPYLLALSIIGSDGCGCYLLVSMNSPTYPVPILTEQAEA